MHTFSHRRAITILSLFLSHLSADNNQQLPDSAVQAVPHLLVFRSFHGLYANLIKQRKNVGKLEDVADDGYIFFNATKDKLKHNMHYILQK